MWARVGPANNVFDEVDLKREWAILGVSKRGHAWACPRSVYKGGLDLATEMGTFGKGSGTWKPARRRLVLSQEDSNLALGRRCRLLSNYFDLLFSS